MCNVNWVVDDSIDGPIFARCRVAVAAAVTGSQPLGLNARFRCYRYEAGDYFKPHTGRRLARQPGHRAAVGGRCLR